MPVMPDTLTIHDFRLLRNLIERLCGIALGDEKAYLISTRLTDLLVESSCPDFGSFYRLAAQDANPCLRDRIVDAMTTNETLWFRDSHPFLILRDALLPRLALGLQEGRRQRIRIWSGACSTGQEPYSIAMTVLEFCRMNPSLQPKQFEILASDISLSALERAQSGRYDPTELGRGLSEELRDRYFVPDGATWIVRDELKQMVSFQRFNLMDPPDVLGQVDIVFLRYVSIYFSEASKRSLYEAIARMLGADGFLFISAVESLRGLSGDFAPESHGGGTYYRRT